MKWLTRERVGVAVLVFVLLGGWFRSYQVNQELNAEVDTLNESLSDWMIYGRTRKEYIKQARIGSTLLYRMALKGGYEDVFEFIRPFPAPSLSCEIEELEYFPSVKLIVFRRARFDPDSTCIALEDCRSVLILVESKTLDILDYSLHRGTIEPSEIAFDSSANPASYSLTGESPEFDEVQYSINETTVHRAILHSS